MRLESTPPYAFGLTLADLTEEQQVAAMQVLEALLSDDGYQQVVVCARSGRRGQPSSDERRSWTAPPG